MCMHTGKNEHMYAQYAIFKGKIWFFHEAKDKF